MIDIVLSKGRIEKTFIKRLMDKRIINKIDYDRELVIKTDNIKILIVNSKDVFSLLDNKSSIGIVGSDVIEEYGQNEFLELLDLNSGVCDFSLATMPTTKIEDIKTIATKYPKIAMKCLKELKLNCEIIKKNGSLELYPRIGYVDGIIDLVETGKTLEANGLVVLKRFDKISTKVITKNENQENKEIKKLINELR